MSVAHERPRRPPPSPPARPRSPDPADAAFGLADFVAEQMLMLGAGSTVMYQLAMKGVGLGVAEHSTTLSRPVDRLRTTLTYVFVMTLGTEDEKTAVARMVNRMHAPVRSAGRYSAFDPELQLWVAATLARNGEQLYERVFGPMDAATRERVYRDSWIFGTALQVTPGDVAADARRVRDLLGGVARQARGRPRRAVLRQAAAARRTGAPLVTRLALPLQSLLTRGNLDPRTRQVLALPWSRRDQVLYDAFWKVFVPVYLLVPRTAAARSRRGSSCATCGAGCGSDARVI